MRVPISWLRQYVALPDDTDVIAERLAMLGFPVDDIIRRPTITGVVVGRIVELEKHPNADRLQVGKIDVGSGELLTIATAATNVAQGQTIPVATIGAQLPAIKIERRKMRGVESEGMMVSAEELALPSEWFEDGIMQLDAGTPLGTNVVELFGLADDILDVEVTSNRVDAMSIVGLARELAASFGVPLQMPAVENPGVDEDGEGDAPYVTLESADCTRFVVQRFDNVKVAPAPAWMRIRLALAGQRPINNLVDISNYVMFETAQPLHFYDAAMVNNSHFIVRDSREGETLRTLDDEERKLPAHGLVIADAEKALGLAGLMGGAASEVRESTKSILLESANFNGARVRRMAMALAMRTEASSRHEKTLAPYLTDVGAARAAQLLIDLGAHAYRPHVFGAALTDGDVITLRLSDVKRLLGLDLDAERISQHLRALGCMVVVAAETLTVTPPMWRRDITLPADLVEEIARMEGYDAIEALEPSVPAHEISSAQYTLENRMADTLAALGYHEVVNYALQGVDMQEGLARAGITPSHTIVEVRNPLSEDQRYLRWALGPALLRYLSKVGTPMRVFEFGHVFTLDERPITEAAVVAFGFTAAPLDEPEWRDSHFLRLKGDVEALFRTVSGVSLTAARDVRTGYHPGKTAVLMHDGREVAVLGQIDPRVARSFDVEYRAYLCNIYLDNVPLYHIPRYQPPSKFPSTYRDLAVVVDFDVTAERIAQIVRKAIGDTCIDVRVLDEYRGPQAGEGKKSVTVRSTIGRTDATITDAEADEVMERAKERLRADVGAAFRE